MLVLSMDPNNQNPQGDSGALNKLEQDLQNLTQQAATTPPPVPEVQQIPVPPQVPEIPPVVPTPSTPPVTPVDTNTFIPETPKKGSPILIIAIILAIVALLAVVAYVFGAKYFNPKPTPTPVVVVTPTPTPDVTVNWKTYNNSEIGFGLKYPQEWTLQATSTGRVASFDTKSGIPGEFFVAYQKNIGSLTQWLLDNKAGEITNTINVNANQFSVIKGGTLYVSREYAIKVKTDSYLRLVIEPYPNSVVFDEVINQILSTFKFTEATSLGSPTASPASSPTSSPSATPSNDGAG
jgi:hypothetical protein